MESLYRSHASMTLQQKSLHISIWENSLGSIFRVMYVRLGSCKHII